MNDTRSCKRCGKPFKYNGYSTVCNNCYLREEEEFARIKEYLNQHPYAKIFEVSTNLDIPLSRIKTYLREERLEIVEKTNAFLLCEKCGKPIRSGSYCDECFKQANQGIKVIYTGKPSDAYGPRISYRKTGNTSLKKTASRY